MTSTLQSITTHVLCALLCATAARPASSPPQTGTEQRFQGVGDFHELLNISTQAGGSEATGPMGSFKGQDVGKTIFVFGAGSEGSQDALTTVIKQVSREGQSALLDKPALRSVKNATGGVGTDNSAELQDCWDASSTQGQTCSLPAGRYLFASAPLTIRRHMQVEGRGPEQTSLVCSPLQRECVLLGDGPIQFVTLANLELRGTEGTLPPPASNEDAQRGFVLRAQGDGAAGGGLWQSSFQHIQVAGFWGDELALLGGTRDTQHPNQFLFFEDVELQAALGSRTSEPPSDSYRLKLTGQNAQIRFIGGQVHGTLAGQFGNGVLIDGAGVVRFEGITCEWLDRCLVVQSGGAISFVNGWVENVKQVLQTGTGPVRGVFFDQNYLANSCFDLKTHTGFCLNASQPSAKDLSFSQNLLAWGTAPDAVLLAYPGAEVPAAYISLNGSIEDLTLGTEKHSIIQQQSDVRSASGRSDWIQPDSRQEVTLLWRPGAFQSANVTASCVTVGTTDVTVLGATVLLPGKITLILENRNHSQPMRSMVNCTALENRTARNGRIQ